MKQVAEAVGVSPATVSLALRDHRSLPAATRQRIKSAANRLGYRANPLVSALMVSLRSKRPVDRHTALALVTLHQPGEPWRSQRTFAEMTGGAEKRAAELGYHLEEFSLRAPGMTPARFTHMLKSRNIHGLLINPLPHEEKTLPLDLRDFAVVGLGPSVTSPPIFRVSNDHFQSMVLALTRCRELGYRRIGFVVSREMSERLEDRWLSGYHLVQQRLPVRQRLEPFMPETTAEIRTGLSAWCARTKPDVVVFGYFSLAFQTLLPRRVGMVALSVYDAAGSLTGIFQDSRRLGAMAVDHLVGRLQHNDFGADESPRLHLVAGKWAPGRTAAGPGTTREILEESSLVTKRR